MARAQMFAQITKVDEEKRLIFARAAQEVPDLSGEIMDYESTAPHFKAWSDETKAATAGKSLGNVRAMHDSIAAGKVVGIEFNHAEKAIDMQVKVVDDAEWNKVVEGVYTGLSMGGEYVKQWQDGPLTRYTAKPIEVSLVDKPCIPTALFFDVQKADGTVMQKQFKAHAPKEDHMDPENKKAAPADEITVHGTAEEVDALLKTIAANHLTVAQTTDHLLKAVRGARYDKATFADEANKRFPLDTDAQVKAAMFYVEQDSAKALYATPEEHEAVRAKVADAFKARFPEGDADAAKAAKPALAKSFYVVQDMAGAVQMLANMLSYIQWEASLLGEEAGAVAEQAKAAAVLLAEALVDMVALQAEALKAEPDADDGPGALLSLGASMGELAKGLRADLVKEGKRHSKADLERVQKMHDLCGELGAKCAKDAKASDEKPEDKKEPKSSKDDGTDEKTPAKAADAEVAKAGGDSSGAPDGGDTHEDSNEAKAKKKKKKNPDGTDSEEDDDSQDEPNEDGEDGKKPDKAAIADTVAKHVTASTPVEKLTEVVNAAVVEAVEKALKVQADTHAGEVAELQKRLTKLEAQPEAPRISLRVVPRGADVGALDKNTQVEPVRAGQVDSTGVNAVASALKAVHMAGGQPLFK